jgi:RHS repeat-associated protein
MVTSAGATYQFVTDQAGSVRLVVDTASGLVVERMDWDEFGNVLNDSAPGTHPFGLVGGIQDVEAQQAHLGARDYDPKSGRWRAKDPLLFVGGSSALYAYVDSDQPDRSLGSKPSRRNGAAHSPRLAWARLAADTKGRSRVRPWVAHWGRPLVRRPWHRIRAIGGRSSDLLRLMPSILAK